MGERKEGRKERTKKGREEVTKNKGKEGMGERKEKTNLRKEKRDTYFFPLNFPSRKKKNSENVIVIPSISKLHVFQIKTFSKYTKHCENMKDISYAKIQKSISTRMVFILSICTVQYSTVQYSTVHYYLTLTSWYNTAIEV